MNVYDVDLLIPCMMFFIGLWMHRFPPKTINGIMGYRTRRSMANQRNWDYANTTTGKIWMIEAFILLPLIFFSKGFGWSDPDTVLLANTFGSFPFLFYPVFYVERRLKKGIE